ncbi:MAG: hypothetical protein JWP97_5136 [Labilithrix sp.]|nr:hypothetical protein [Labilithrix sp.]
MKKCLPAALLGAAALLVTAQSQADEAADTATARTLGVEGVTLANSGNCKEASEKLERAEKLHHAPTTATRLGECEIELGRLVRGTERLQRVIREPLGATPHPAFATAVARARKALEGALPRVASLRVGVAAPPGTKLLVTIDDEPMSDATVDTDRAMDPGTHTVGVTAEGFFPAKAVVVLEEGQAKTVPFELRRDPNAVARATAPLSTGDPAGAESRPPTSSRLPYVLAAIGGATLGLGAGVLGAVQVSDKQASLDAVCGPRHVCPTSAQHDIDGARTWATVSTVGFVTAGVSAAALAALFLTAPAARPAQTGLRMRPRVGATSVGLDGVF